MLVLFNIHFWLSFFFFLQSGRASSGKSTRSRKASAKSVRSQASDRETPQNKEGENKEAEQEGRMYKWQNIILQKQSYCTRNR